MLGDLFRNILSLSENGDNKSSSSEGEIFPEELMLLEEEIKNNNFEVDKEIVKGVSILAYCVYKGEDYIEVSRMLLEHGANPNVFIEGVSILEYTIYNNYLGIAEELLKHRAIVDIPDKSTGYTPMLTAVIGGNVSAINLLLKYGSNINQSFKGLSILDMAKELGHSEIIKILSDHLVDMEKEYHNISSLFLKYSQKTIIKHDNIDTKTSEDEHNTHSDFVEFSSNSSEVQLLYEQANKQLGLQSFVFDSVELEIS